MICIVYIIPVVYKLSYFFRKMILGKLFLGKLLTKIIVLLNIGQKIGCRNMSPLKKSFMSHKGLMIHSNRL